MIKKYHITIFISPKNICMLLSQTMHGVNVIILGKLINDNERIEVAHVHFVVTMKPSIDLQSSRLE